MRFRSFRLIAAVLVTMAAHGIARADHVLTLDVGGGWSERGPGLAGRAELAAGGISLSSRAEVGRGLAIDDDGQGAGRAGTELSIALGFAPRFRLSETGSAFRLGAPPRYHLHPESAPQPARPSARRPLFIGVGARAGTGGFSDQQRVALMAMVRWRWVETGATFIVRGRDRPRLKHSTGLPGVFVGARIPWRFLAMSAEVGATGLTYRDDAGASRPEVYARTYLSLCLAL